MDHTGRIFEKSETGVADLVTETIGDYMIVRINVNNMMVIRFPMPADTDSNELILRTTNIINQTGMIANTCRVELDT